MNAEAGKTNEKNEATLQAYQHLLSSALASGRAQDLTPLIRLVSGDHTIPYESRLRVLQAVYSVAAAAPEPLADSGDVPRRRTILVYQPWFNFDFFRMIRSALSADHLIALFAGFRVSGRRRLRELGPDNWREYRYGGHPLWDLCAYRLSVTLRRLPESIDAGDPAVMTAIASAYGEAAELIDEGTLFLRHYRPESVVYAQGCDLIAAVMRRLAIAAGVRTVAVENIFRKDRLAWDDVDGLAINSPLPRAYFRRYAPLVSAQEAESTVQAFFDSVTRHKLDEHASGTSRQLPPYAGPTVVYLGQVGTDAAILHGRRGGFRSQIDGMVACARAARDLGARLVIKLHPKESPGQSRPEPHFRGLTAAALKESFEFAMLRGALKERLIVDEDNAFDTYALIKGSAVCVTMNSQAGLEALALGREVVLCGDAFYGDLGFTHDVRHPEELEAAIGAVLAGAARANRTGDAQKFFHIFTQLYSLPKTEATLLALGLGRPEFPPAPGGGTVVRSMGPAAGVRPGLDGSREVSALDLFTPRRLDLVVKYRFFKALDSGVGLDEAEQRYRRHIQARTRGVEPIDRTTGCRSAKATVDDYVRTCRELLESMRSAGYDRNHPIPVGPGGEIGNGAHRAACALALGMNVMVRPCEEAGPPWDACWFAENGFAEEEVAALLAEWSELQTERAALFILWAPAEEAWARMEADIARNFEIVGRRDFDFGEHSAAFDSVVYDIYSHGRVESRMDHIERKLRTLSVTPRRFRVVLACNRSAAEKTGDLATRTKRNLRSDYAAVVPPEGFVTAHASDSADEARYLSRVLLDPRNTRWFGLRKRGEPREELLGWIEDFKRQVAQLGIPVEDCCVVGSSSLEIFALRDSTDLDFTLRARWRHKHFNAGITHLSEMVDVVTEGYHRVHPPRAAVSDDALVLDPANHFWFRGVKFASLAIVRDRKDFSRRPKDVRDVALIDAFDGADAALPLQVAS